MSLGLPRTVHISTNEMLSYRDGQGLFVLKLANVRASHSHVSTGRPTFFDGHYLRNSSTLDIGVLGYISIVQHKKHSPEVMSIPPGTHCIYIYIYRVSQEECAIFRESVPYVKLYRYNPKHLYPKLNGYGDNGQRKVWTSCISA